MPMRTFLALCQVLEVHPAEVIDLQMPASPTLEDLIPEPSLQKLRFLAIQNETLVADALFRAIQLIEEIAGLYESARDCKECNRPRGSDRPHPRVGRRAGVVRE